MHPQAAERFREFQSKLNHDLSAPSDSWDWPFLWFVGLHILRIPEERFWKLTPRQLHTFFDQYVRYHENTKSQKGGKRQPAASSGGLAFIDEIM